MVRRLVVSLGCAAAVSIALAGSLPAQTGVLSGVIDDQSNRTGLIAGVVFDGATKVGLEGVEVRVVGTKLRAVTGPSGRYEFRSVAPGRYEVEGRRVGYIPDQDDSVDVEAGNVTKAYLVLRPIATMLENVLMTGDGVTTDNLSVPARDAAQSIQGKVAGVAVAGSGLPGTEMMIQLRAATSIRGNRPLIIVDGVTLATAQASTLDISTMDIRSVEILKGAAASAAYGARGAAGVIIIRTNRGRE